MKRSKRVLVAPLDWGLGHATRCIPVIRELIRHDVDVVIGADKGPLALLRQEFPQLESITFRGYEIRYPDNGNMSIHMAGQAPKILKRIRQEHRQVEDIVQTHGIDAVISDNRFGLWSEKVPCVFITHQLLIKAPAFEGLLHKVNKRYIQRFSECWIPDLPEGQTLSGDLSHGMPLPEKAKFVGLLSRFNPGDSEANAPVYDIMAIISGPEPQRTNFEQLLLNNLHDSGLKAMVVLGKADEQVNERNNGIEIHSHLDSTAMEAAILSSKVIVSRPGYSTIMDLATLGKRAVFVPTPGQTEQEYLAGFHMEQGHYLSVNQDNFNLMDALAASGNYTGITVPENSLLQKAVSGFIQQLVT